jgi:hypothetical protein
VGRIQHSFALAVFNPSFDRRRVTRADFKDAASDLGLWGHLLLSNVTLTPTNPLGTCKQTCCQTSVNGLVTTSTRSSYCHQVFPLQCLRLERIDCPAIRPAMHNHAHRHTTLGQSTRTWIPRSLWLCVSILMTQCPISI